jgi:hypothetical protein
MISNIGPWDVSHKGLMLPALITLPHFSVSSAMNFPKLASQPAIAVVPMSANRSFILGSARAAVYLVAGTRLMQTFAPRVLQGLGRTYALVITIWEKADGTRIDPSEAVLRLAIVALRSFASADWPA